jgi:hypothetical protein
MPDASPQAPRSRRRGAQRLAALPAPLRLLLLDLLLPSLVLLLGALWLGGPTARHPASMVSAKLTGLLPLDYGATAWFYQHVAGAISGGHPVVSVPELCAPTGTTLGNNFPNWVDAIVAAPLVGGLPFPTGLNLWLALLPVLSGLAAYAALRALTPRRSLALLGAWIFGFNAYSAYEATMGRPTLALLAIIPLVLAVWLRATSSRGKPLLGWSIGAGLLAGLALHYYVLYAIVAWLLAGLVWLGRLLAPPAGTGRRSLLLAALLALVTAGLTAAPYLHQATVVQPRFPAPATVPDDQAGPGALIWTAGQARATAEGPLAPWDPDLWAFTLAFARDHLGGERASPSPISAEQSLDEMARHALPLSYPWRGAPLRGDPAGLLPLPWLAPLVLLLALAAGRRTLPWLAVWGLLWVLSLGPWLTDLEGLHSAPVLLEGQRLRLPLWFLAEHLPEAGSFIKPNRFFPGFLLGMVLCLTVTLDLLATRGERWVAAAWGPARHLGWPVLVGLLLVITGLAQGRVVAQLDHSLPYEPWPFHQRLAQEPGDFAIIELPLGLGQGLAGFQAIHGKRRADDHHDALAAQQAGEPPPDDCFELPLLSRLWELGRGRVTPRILDPADLAQARDAGFRFIVLYPEAYPALATRGVRYELGTVRAVLERSLGAPVYEDEHTVAWELGS